MILLLDTSTPTCRITLTNGDWTVTRDWEAGRGLAKGLLAHLQQYLDEYGKTWADLTGLVAFKGPGSFTGLRIGITVLNSLAYAQNLPIVGEMGDDWQTQGVQRLQRGENDEIVLPEYGGEANITQPRK
jgi:tRNA threonylcarbamoyladenosine biosynthesis protein TsaB